jgi:hypothetical protein
MRNTTVRVFPLANLIFMLALFAGTGSAFQDVNQEYLPLSKAETARRFPLRHLGMLINRPPGYQPSGDEKLIPERLNIGPSGATVKHDGDENLIISGKDRNGRDWQFLAGALASSYGCRFYVADLDRNRIRDAVFVCPTGGNGLAPSRHIFTLTFDAAGRPVPFEADGYFDDRPEGVFDLVDTDGDGRAELIYMNYDDGYWITNLYEVSGARWQRIVGRHGRRAYPLYTRFTNRPNRRPATPRRGRNPSAPDLSNSTPKRRGFLRSYQWADIAQSEDIALTVSDGRGGEVVCSPVAWYGSFGFVVDSDSGRMIFSAYGNEERTKSLLDEIAGKKIEVSLYGQRVGGKCSPEWVWVVR